MDKRLEFIRTFIPGQNRVFKEQFRLFMASYLDMPLDCVNDQVMMNHMNAVAMRYFTNRNYYRMLHDAIGANGNLFDAFVNHLRQVEVLK